MVFSLLDSRIFFRKTRRPWTSLHPRQCPARGRSRRLLSRPPKVASGSYSIGSEDGRTNCTVCKLQDHVFRVFVSGKFLFSRMPLALGIHYCLTQLSQQLGNAPTKMLQHSTFLNPGGWGRGYVDYPIFGRSVLGCINADFCKWRWHLQNVHD